MGVQASDNHAQVKAILGVPEDEPIFILRAQDAFSVRAIREYRKLTHDVVSEEFTEGLCVIEEEFQDWRYREGNAVKIPDLASKE